jgi:hypothetical protein
MAAFDFSKGEGLPLGSSGSLASFFSHSTHTGMSWMYISVGAPQFMHLSTSGFYQNAALGYTIEHVQCPERERLAAAYLSALDRINDAGLRRMRLMQAWSLATRQSSGIVREFGRQRVMRTAEAKDTHP